MDPNTRVGLRGLDRRETDGSRRSFAQDAEPGHPRRFDDALVNTREFDPEHPYPASREICGIVAVSGRLGVSRPGVLVEGGFEAEAKAALGNMRIALEEVGAELADLLQVVVYLTDVSDRTRLNAIYAEFLGDSRPARSCVGVASLPYGGCIEIEALAVRKVPSPALERS